jgi:hypothetical protein
MGLRECEKSDYGLLTMGTFFNAKVTMQFPKPVIDFGNCLFIKEPYISDVHIKYSATLILLCGL